MKKLIFVVLCLISQGLVAQRIGELVIFYPQNPQNNRHQGLCPAFVTGLHASPDSLDLFVLFAEAGYQPSPDIIKATDRADAFSGNERWSTVAQAMAWGIDLTQHQQVLSTSLPDNNTDYKDWYYDVSGNTETFWNDSTGGTGNGKLATKYSVTTALKEIELPSQTGNSGKYLTTNGTTTSWASFTTVKKTETFSGTTNESGVYTVTFGQAYSVAPNIQANITNQSNTNQFIRISSISTTGFTVNVFQRNSINLLGTDVLLFSTANVSGATVDVYVIEK